MGWDGYVRIPIRKTAYNLLRYNRDFFSYTNYTELIEDAMRLLYNVNMICGGDRNCVRRIMERIEEEAKRHKMEQNSKTMW